MTNIELWPNITFLFVATNLAAWYFHGAVLFSWWWLLPVFVLQVVTSVALLAIGKAVIEATQ